MSTWSSGISLRGLAGAQIRSGTGAPSPTNPTNQADNDYYLATDTGQFYGPRSGGAFPATPLFSLMGVNGLSVLSGNGAPAANLGQVGSPAYIDVQNARIYGAKTASGWPTSFVSLVGTATVPNDLTANSLVVAPVSGDTNAVRIALLAGNGTVLFAVDASGSAFVGGNLSVSGSTTLSGAVSAASTLTAGSTVSGATFLATSTGSPSNTAFGYRGTFQGGSGLYYSGLHFNSQYGQLSEIVGGYAARTYQYVTGSPSDNGAASVTHSSYSAVSGQNPAFRWYVGNGLTMTLQGNLSVLFGGNVSVGGALTASGVNLASGSALTFPDGTTQTTAASAAAAGSSAQFIATALGTVSAPAYTQTANSSTGLYFTGSGASGALNVAVGGANAATFGSGGSFATPGPHTGSALTISATSGRLTFGDGTFLTTAPAAGSAAQFTATALGSVTAPAFTQTANSSTGLFFSGSGATSALNVAVSGASAAVFGQGGTLTTTGLATVPNLTLSGTSGKLTFSDGTSMTTAATATGGGSGNIIRYGMGPPTSTYPAVQNDGDGYLDQQQSMYYAPRQNGTWPAPISLIGPTGPQGPTGPAGTVTRSMVYMGSFWNQNTGTNTVNPMIEVVQSGSTVGQTPFVSGMVRGGSITGYSFNQVGPVSGSFTLTVQKNGTTFATFSNIGSGITSTKPFTGSFAAGTYTFAAGDGLTLSVQTSGSGNLQSMGFLEITTA